MTAGARLSRTMAKLPSKRKDAPSPGKARAILRDGTVHGHALTKAQRGFFGAVAAMSKSTGPAKRCWPRSVSSC